MANSETTPVPREDSGEILERWIQGALTALPKGYGPADLTIHVRAIPSDPKDLEQDEIHRRNS